MTFAGFLGLGGLWAGQALVGLGEYPFFAVLRLAVSPLRRVTFSRRRKGNRKGLLLRSALAGSGSFATGPIRAQRLRFASLHLLPLCSTSSNGRCAPTPGSIPPLSLPTSPVDQKQDQKHSSLRSLLSGAASPRAAALLCFFGSEPARDDGGTFKCFERYIAIASRLTPTRFCVSPVHPSSALNLCRAVFSTG